MAEEFVDPREVPWHPRRRHGLIGHEAAEARLAQALQSGKLHHAWLITGPKGIGKATLAFRFARYLVTEDAARLPMSLETPDNGLTARLLAAGSHPNIHVLQRAVDQKAKRLKTEIAVDDARSVIEFATRTSASGGWRVIVVDAADELNLNSANALLKMIEEPTANTIFLIVCHQPGSLLRTIRSRCIHLPLSPLTQGQTLGVLEDLPAEATGKDESALQQAAALSRGSPGWALAIIGSKGAAAFADLQARTRLSPAVCVEVGAQFGGRVTPEDFGIFCDLLTGWISARAREAGLQGRGAALAAAHDDIVSSLRQTDALNLDRRQAVTDALLRVEDALKAP